MSSSSRPRKTIAKKLAANADPPTPPLPRRSGKIDITPDGEVKQLDVHVALDSLAVFSAGDVDTGPLLQALVDNEHVFRHRWGN